MMHNKIYIQEEIIAGETATRIMNHLTIQSLKVVGLFLRQSIRVDGGNGAKTISPVRRVKVGKQVN